MVSQSALSGREQNYKDEKSSFEAFYFKRKMRGGVGGKQQSNWDFHNANDVLFALKRPVGFT